MFESGRVVGTLVRASTRAVATVGLVVVFGSATTAAIVLHANLPVARELAADLGRAAIVGVFTGEVVFARVERIDVGRTTRVRLGEVTITSEDRRVVVARGIEASLALGALLRSLASGGAVEVTVDDARIDDADVDLSTTADGELHLARAFRSPPRKPTALGSALPAGTGRPPPRIRVRGARVRHTWVHGDLVRPPLDADVDEAHATVVYEDGVVRIEDVTGRARVRSPRLPGGEGALEGVLRGALALGLEPGAGSGELAFEGQAGALPVTASAAYRDGRVEGRLEAKEAPAETWTRLMPFLPLRAPASLRVVATGAWPSVDLDATVTAGASRAHVVGSLDLGDTDTFRADVVAEDVDLAAFAGPRSRLAVRGRVQGSRTSAGLLGTFRVDEASGAIDDNPLPNTSIEGRFEGGLVAGTVRATEPGLSASGKLVLDPTSRTVVFDVQARANDLGAVTRTHRFERFSGAASVRASGKVDLDTGRVHGALTASGENVAGYGASATNARGTASFSGPLAAPTFDASVTATRLRYTEPGKTPLEYAEATARARVDLVPATRFTNVVVELGVDAATPKVVARADSVRSEGGRFAVSGARVEGLGAPVTFDVSGAGRTFSIRARGEDVAIERVARASGLGALAALPKGSRASFDVDLRSDGRTLDGHAEARVVSEGFAEASIDAAVKDGRIVGTGRVEMTGVGHVEASRFDVALATDASGSLALAETTGTADLAGEVDLGSFAAQLLGDLVTSVDGKLSLSGHVERNARDAAPQVRVTATTHGLDVRAERLGKKPIHAAGVDATVHLAWDGATDDAEASLVAWDAKGPLATASAKSRIPLLEWATGRRSPSADALAALAIEARVDVTKREIAGLPAWLPLEGSDGRLGLSAEAHGRLAAPELVANATATNLRRRGQAAEDARFLPVDAAASMRWDGEDLVVTVTADERARRRVSSGPVRKLGSARGLLIGKMSASDLLHGRAGDAPLRGSVELDVDDVDLAPLPLPYDARGRLSGRFRVKDMPTQPSFEATAKVTDVVLAEAQVGSGDLVVAGHDGFLYSLVRLAPPDGGSVTAQVVSNALRLGPDGAVWDETLTTRLDYALESGRLSLLRPFAASFAPEIDGFVDGRGSVTFSASEQSFDGGLAIRDARLYVNALGEEITELAGVARFERTGTFRVDEIRGKVGLGSLRASASGKLRGLGVSHVEATMVVPPPRGVPLSSEAATFGEATGEMSMVVDVPEDDGPVQVEIMVPRGNVTIPDRSAQALQSLDPDRTITLGVRAPDGELLRVTRRGRLVSKKAIVSGDRLRGGRLGDLGRTPRKAEDEIDARFDVLVGPDVLVEGRGMRMRLGGRTVVELADELDVKGQITLAEGTIDVQGRRFSLDHGTISFPEGGEPDNPTIVASAYWDAPDGTRVWAEYAAPLETGTLVLRSEPPYSKNEILSLLLFGRAEGNLAAKGSGSAVGTGVAGGLVATGLNRALDEVASGEFEFEANVGSTRFNQSRPEIGVRRKNLGVSVGYVVGPPSYVQPDRTVVTVDWQFIPRWSLVATRGDRSTSIVDVLYRFRY